MAKDPAVLLYTADFLVGVMAMNNDQVGAYIRLLCLQHQKGHLTEKDMLSVCGMEDEDVYDKFLIDKDGLYYNRRMDEEIAKRGKGSDASRENGKKGGRPSKVSMDAGDNDADKYEEVFEHYMTLGLIKHKAFTPEMRNAIDVARRRGKYSWDELKTMLDRHAHIVKLTAGEGEYAVKPRPLTEFFGQRVNGGTALICSEYADDGAKWLRYKNGKPKASANGSKPNTLSVLAGMIDDGAK